MISRDDITSSDPTRGRVFIRIKLLDLQLPIVIIILSKSHQSQRVVQLVDLKGKGVRNGSTALVDRKSKNLGCINLEIVHGGKKAQGWGYKFCVVQCYETVNKEN